MAEATTLPAAVAEPGPAFHSLAKAFAAEADRAVASGDTARIANGDLERVITAAIRLYAAKCEAEGAFPPPVSADKITPTDAAVFVSEVLRAADLSLFDLAMWYRRAR